MEILFELFQSSSVNLQISDFVEVVKSSFGYMSYVAMNETPVKIIKIICQQW